MKSKGALVASGTEVIFRVSFLGAIFLGVTFLHFPRVLALTPSSSPNSASTDYTTAPPFTLKGLDGHAVNLSRYRGKVVLLDFWATWCAPCQLEIPHFVQFQNKYQARGLQVLGVSMDDEPAPVRTFYHKFKINYPVAMGDLIVAKAYGGILGLPVTLLIGRDGRIHAKHIGPVDMLLLEAEIKALL